MSLIKIALAACPTPGGIVPECGPTGPIFDEAGVQCAPQCDWASLLTLGTNIVDTLTTSAFLIATLFFMIGAFRMIISQGSPDKISAAKSNITSAVVGLVIVLTAWVVLNTALNVLLIKKEGCHREWYRFQGLECELTMADLKVVV